MSNLASTIYSLLFTVVLADSSSVPEADKLPSPPIPPFLQDFFSSNPVFAWVFWLFTAIAVGVAALAVFTGNLQKIIDFIKNNFSRTKVGVDDGKLLKFRKQLLNRLESDISIRQKNSLHKLIQIDLAKEEQRRQVGGSDTPLAPEDQTQANNNLLNRFVRIFRNINSQESDLKPNQKIIDLYDREDIQGKLLILGEPGAGKTTELLSLTRDLIQRAVEEENAPIPIIFELSSWKNDQPIGNWLMEQLPEIYPGLPKAIAESWINNQQIIPLLDGLDELGSKTMDECILAINKFLDSSFQSGLVLCCRREEYEQAQNKLNQLNGAIYLSPLSNDQIQQYLKRLNRSSIWDETIINEPSFLELVRKPLFLSMLVVAYQGRRIKNYTELFEAYIEKQLHNLDSQGTYPPGKSPSQKQTLHYLVWLARKLDAERETEFLIESMQPTWLESKKQKIVYRVIVGLIFGLIFGLVFGVITVLNFGLIFGLLYGLIISLVVGLVVGLIGGLNTGLNLGLIFMLSGGIVGILIYEILFGLILNQNRIKLVAIKLTEKISWSLRNFFRNVLVIGLVAGSFFGLIVGLIASLRVGLVVGLFLGLLTGLLGGLVFGLLGGLLGGFNNSAIEHKNFPNQGIWNSLKNGLILGLLVGLFVGLLYGLVVGLFLGLLTGMLYGLIFGLIAGLKSVIQHFTLRLVLYRNGYIPWNYAKFLDHAAKHRFIQRVGGRYRFMHDLLRKHFAQMPLS